MTSTRRLSLPLLITALLLPPAAVQAQDLEGPGEWVASEDAHLFVRPGDPTVAVAIDTLSADAYPHSLAGLPLPDDLPAFESDTPGATDFDVFKLVDRSTVPDPGAGREPVVALFGANGTPAFAADQHAFGLPPTCTTAAVTGRCLDSAHAAGLVSMFSPQDPPLFDTDGTFVAQGTLAHPGAVLVMAGGATVKTKVKAKPGQERITVNADADILPGFGGMFAGFDAEIIDLDDLEPQPGVASGSAGDGGYDFDTLVDGLRDTEVRKNGTAQRRLACPHDGRGVVASHYYFEGLGGSAAGLLGIDDLTGGASVVVTEFDPFECGTPPPPPPLAALGCIDMGVRHSPLGDAPSFVEVDTILFTFGLPDGPPPIIDVAVGGMNDGEPLPLELVELDLVPGPDAILPATSPVLPPDRLQAWYASGEAGIRSLGPKPVRSFRMEADGATIDLSQRVRKVVGKRLQVGPRERTRGDCPGLRVLTPEQLSGVATAIYADGFGSGDTSAWSESGR